jgi:uncharacterized DUF497 family protein
MLLHVEWNAERSASNLAECGVRFDEAATVFGDPLSRTIADRAAEASRFVTFGLSHRGRMLVVVHVDRGSTIWIVRALRGLRTAEPASRRAGAHEQFADYNFRSGVRGKYVARYWESAAQGTLRRAQRAISVRSS